MSDEVEPVSLFSPFLASWSVFASLYECSLGVQG